MASPDNFDPLIPIPNDPFYFPASWNFYTPSTNLVYGPGFTINPVDGTVTVVQLPPPVIGTVTKITSGTGITTTPITGISVSGSISLKAYPAPLVPGAYKNTTLTVDQYGKVTVASDGVPPIVSGLAEYPVSLTGAAPTLTIAIAVGTTLSPGTTQLVDDLITTDNTKSLTAKQGYILNQNINAVSQTPVEGQFYAGTFSALSQTIVSVTSLGLSRGFLPGGSLPLPGSSSVEGFVVCTDKGPFSPPGWSGTPYNVQPGDYFYCGNTQWLFIRNSFDYPYATTTTPGLVQLATQASVVGFTNNTFVCTPYSLDSINATTTERGWVYQASDLETQQLLSPVKAVSPANLNALAATLFDRGILSLVDSFASTSTTEGVTINAVKQTYDAITLKSFINAVGDVITGTGPAAPYTLGRGAATYRLTVDDSVAHGLSWKPYSPPQAVKVGTVMWFATDNLLKLPTTWVVCNGASASALPTSPYYDLFQVIGYTFGGAGATFNLPDLRGKFVRGWSGAGGTAGAIDNPRVFGSTQLSNVVQHTHPLPSLSHNHVVSVNDVLHNHSVGSATIVGGTTGYFPNKDTGAEFMTNGNASANVTMTAVDALTGPLDTLTNTAPAPTDQTRPVNFPMVPIIRYTYGGVTPPSNATPEYFVSSTTATAPPSTNWQIEILTVNVPRGTTLYWEIGGSAADASLWVPATLTGTTTVGQGNLAAFNLETAASYPAPPYVAEIKIYSDAARTIQVGNAVNVDLL